MTGNVRLTDMLICNNSPLVLVSAASMVMLADRHNQHHGFINWLASSTMAIYLITASGLHQIIEKRLFSDITYNFIHGLFSIALVCAVCLLTDKLRILLFMPLDKKVERWISGKERKSPF